ncbi:Plug domain-containing protein [Phenylobacterium sp.]|uniref:Plug domain-containing protein n=1 Tax=Phenylobacterium sp. TaxID=1871053 RepID=UPI003D265A1F
MKRLTSVLLTASAVALSLTHGARAQAPRQPSNDTAPAAGAAPEDEFEVEEVVVVGGRTTLRGSVVGEASPELTLDPREIRALGVSSVDELLAALEPQLASGRGRGGGRPVTLVNGMRISSYAEIRDLPPEAIARMEVLPEEVSLRYGYRADQRVVNFVLRRRFQALTVESGVTLPTAGGRAAANASANVLRLRGDTRTQLDVKGSYSGALLESERDVRRTDGQNGALRSLLPQGESLAVNGVLARPFGEILSGSVNGRFEVTGSEGRLGPSGDPLLAAGALDPLRRLNDGSAAHLGGGLNGAISGWRWSVTANADRDKSRTITETAYDPILQAFQASNVSRSTTTSADIEALVNGSLFQLPAGPVNLAMTVGADTLDLKGESFRRGVFRDTDLDRQSGRAQINVDAPLFSRTRGGSGVLGSLSLNFNAEVEELSDFGTLTTLGGGVTWSPIEAIRLVASITDEDGAPTVQQLGNPEIATPSVRVFDFTRGETVEVTRIEGGNPNLTADSRRVLKLGVTLKPFDETDFVVRADYTRTRLEDEVASFPAATPEIEAAFPGRFVRDASGRLVQVDVRPVNFAEHNRDELRWGFNYSRPLKNTRPPPFAPQRPAGAPAADEGGRGPGGGFSGRGGGFGNRGGAGGNLQFAVFHTWRLKDDVLIRPGVPVLDLLDGQTLGGGSVTPKNQVDVQAGVSRNGLGARMTARWQEGGRLESGFGGSGLKFSDLSTLNLRLFADLGMQPMARENPWMRGARVSLSVDNLFDEQVDVRDSAGAIPISYQPDLLDPLGRTLRISFRKIFLPPRAVPPPGARREPRT